MTIFAFLNDLNKFLKPLGYFATISIAIISGMALFTWKKKIKFDVVWNLKQEILRFKKTYQNKRYTISKFVNYEENKKNFIKAIKDEERKKFEKYIDEFWYTLINIENYIEKLQTLDSNIDQNVFNESLKAVEGLINDYDTAAKAFFGSIDTFRKSNNPTIEDIANSKEFAILTKPYEEIKERDNQACKLDNIIEKFLLEIEKQSNRFKKLFYAFCCLYRVM